VNRSLERLSREVEVLRGKIQTLSLAQRRIEREAVQLAKAIGNSQSAGPILTRAAVEIPLTESEASCESTMEHPVRCAGTDQ
jgi:hypothetical protein